MQITFNDLRIAVIMMKRAPLQNMAEAEAVQGTIDKFEGIAQAMLAAQKEAASDDKTATQ